MTSEPAQAKDTASVAAILIFGGFAISVIIFAAFSLSADVSNSSFEWSKAISRAVLMGIFAAFLTMPITLIAGAVAATLGYKILGKLPLWYLVVLLPVCAAALCIQNRVNGFFFSEITWLYIGEGLAPILICYLIACWRLTKKKQPQL